MVEQKQNKTFWEEWREYNDKDKSDFPLDYRTWLERKVESERSRHEKEMKEIKNKFCSYYCEDEQLRCAHCKTIGRVFGGEKKY
jgi:hypothetical protein